MFCYWIGLAYMADHKSYDEIKNLWPMALLAAPLLYGLARSTIDFQVIPATIILALWIGYALYFLHTDKADISRTTTGLFAGICLVDALLISTVSSLPIASLAVGAFCLTLLLQRYLSVT